MIEPALEFIENGVIFVQFAQIGPDVFVDGNGEEGLGFHPQIPQICVQVIAGQERIAIW